MNEHRDRERRKTLAKMSPAALEVWGELVSGEERSKAERVRLRGKLALLPGHQQRYIMRLWRRRLEEAESVLEVAVALSLLKGMVDDFLEAHPTDPVPDPLREMLARLEERYDTAFG